MTQNVKCVDTHFCGPDAKLNCAYALIPYTALRVQQGKSRSSLQATATARVPVCQGLSVPFRWNTEISGGGLSGITKMRAS